MKRIYTTLFLLLACLATLAAQKTMDIPYLQEHPQLDGQVTDACWSSVPEISDFITAMPVFNETPATETKVKIFRTEDAIYVSVYCFSKKVRADRSFRDYLGTGDYFKVAFDTWHDGQNAFVFGVTAGDAQYDARISATNQDLGWNAIWESKATLHDDGWSAELRIPFEALRFPRGAQKDWGIQFTRFDRKTGYLSTWSPQNPLIGDQVLQYGILKPMNAVSQSQRISMEMQNATALNWAKGYVDGASTLNMDLKVGLNSATTLDMAILPSLGADFSREKFRDTIIKRFSYVNLGFSQQETSRQFFNEEESLFQSRYIFEPNQRISSYYHRYKVDSSQLLPYAIYTDGVTQAAIKYTTRTKNNIGIGAYSTIIDKAVANVGFAKTPIVLQNRSNYSYLFLEKALKNNAFINVTNSILITGGDYANHKASLAFRLRDKTNRYEISGAGKGSPLDNTNGNANYKLQIAKANGHWLWALRSEHNITGPFPGIERGGLVPKGSLTNFAAGISYRAFKQQKNWLNTRYFGSIYRATSLDKLVDNFSVGVGTQGLDTKFRTWELGTFVTPTKTPMRVLNSSIPVYDPESISVRGSFNSDIRKRLTLNIYGNTQLFRRSRKLDMLQGISVRWQLNNQSSIDFSSDFRHSSSISTAYTGLLFNQVKKNISTNLLKYAWMPTSKILVEVFGGYTTDNEVSSKIVAILPSGEIREIEDDPNKPKARVYRLLYGAECSYNFSGMSQIRLSHQSNPNYFSIGSIPNIYSRTPNVTTNLSVIWFLDIQPNIKI